MPRHKNARSQGLFRASVNVMRALSGRGLALSPEAMHARHDDRAARPEFLDVSGGAIAHCIGTKPLVARMHPDARRWPTMRTTLSGKIGGRRCGDMSSRADVRRDPVGGDRAAAKSGAKSDAQSRGNCRRQHRFPHLRHNAPPVFQSLPIRSPIAVPASTARRHPATMARRHPPLIFGRVRQCQIGP